MLLLMVLYGVLWCCVVYKSSAKFAINFVLLCSSELSTAAIYIPKVTELPAVTGKLYF